MVRAGAIDKAEEKVRELADAARGAAASAGAKAKYRRALDDLMQLRIDAGTQGTLFDVAPRQTTQRGLPGLFDNPVSEERDRQYRIAEDIEETLVVALRDLPRVGSPKRLHTGAELVFMRSGFTVPTIPRWTISQVDAKRKVMIKNAMREAGVKDADDVRVIGAILERQTRPNY
ncbi:MAG: hypothetical protein WCO67_19150 [Betaproteobacteria bacterium]